MVFLKVKMSMNLLISPDKLDPNGLLFHKTILLRLLEEFAIRRATEKYGYYVAVTSLDNLGTGKVLELVGDVSFPVEYSCITLKPFRGEILDGMVDEVFKHGLALKVGPIDDVFIPTQMMKGYKYVTGENPVFLNEKFPKLEKGTIVRFKVLGVKWMEAERVFRVLGALGNDFLGPVV